jgi:glycolate oxidase FAD binding subunit
MSVSARIIPARLSGIVGDANYFTNPEQLESYAVDGRKPFAVVRSGSSEEIVQVVKFAAVEKLAMVVTGARTKLGIGLLPRQFDLALDVTRLNRVLAYDPGDLTLSVEAGVLLCDVQRTLAEHGQFLPLEVPFMNRATVAGTIASGVDSALRQSYGTARDYILGMEFVTGEGIAAKSGGRVVKNVTGYDIHKLLAGSLGTLGVIIKINLRTFPCPSNIRGFLATSETCEGAIALRNRIAKSPLALLTLEILSPRAAELLTGEAAAEDDPNPFPARLLSSKDWTLTGTFAGNDNVLARCERELREMAELCGASNAETVGEKHVSVFFGRQREFVPIALESSPATTVVKMSVLPSRMAEGFELAAKAADESDLPWAALARGVGVIYFALLPAEMTAQTLKQVAQTTSKILAGCASLGGSATIPWCPGDWKLALNIWGPNRDDFGLMRKLKKLFDPGDVLSPGRFAGGI